MTTTTETANRWRLLTRVGQRITTPADVVLAARMIGWACVLPTLKHIVPLRMLVRFVRRPPRGGARDVGREDQIVTLARWACRLTRWSSGGNCLERALIAYRFLTASGADPWLVVGIGTGDPGQVRGHAWVLVDGTPAGESGESIREFASMVAFGPDGDAVTDPAAWAAPTR